MLHDQAGRNEKAGHQTAGIGCDHTITIITLLTSTYGPKETDRLAIFPRLPTSELVDQILGMALPKYSRNVLMNWGPSSQVLWRDGFDIWVSSM